MMDFAIQVLGVLALSVSTIGLAMRRDHLLRIFNILGLVLWLEYYLLLGSNSAALSLSLALAIVVCGHLGLTRIGWTLLGCNLALVPYMGLARNWMEAAPPAASALINFGVGFLSAGTLTVVVAAGQLLWIFYAVEIEAYHAAANSAIGALALVVRTLHSALPGSK